MQRVGLDLEQRHGRVGDDGGGARQRALADVAHLAKAVPLAQGAELLVALGHAHAAIGDDKKEIARSFYGSALYY